MDRGAWWVTVHRMTKIQTWLKWLSTHALHVCISVIEKQNQRKTSTRNKKPCSNQKQSPLHSYRRCRFNPWVRRIPWRRKWQSTPLFLPGKYHGLVGYSPWGHKNLDTIYRLNNNNNGSYREKLPARFLRENKSPWGLVECLLWSIPHPDNTPHSHMNPKELTVLSSGLASNSETHTSSSCACSSFSFNAHWPLGMSKEHFPVDSTDPVIPVWLQTASAVFFSSWQ